MDSPPREKGTGLPHGRSGTARRTRRGWGRLAVCAYAAFGVLAFLVAWRLEPGYYYGDLSGLLQPTQEILYIRALAETCPRWHWIRPRNHVYQYATLTRTADEDWVLHIDLVSRTWRLGDTTGPLDADALAHLIPAGDGAEVEGSTKRERFDHLLNVLVSMGDGTFYPTDHHGYVFEKPFPARYQHHTLGMGMGRHLVWLWCAVWPVYLFVRRKAYRGVRASPGKVYLVALGVVAAADALCILVPMPFSPGPVHELSEQLLGLVNFPALVLLGDYGFFGPIGFITGAALWATLCSIVAALLPHRQPLASGETA